MRDYDDSNYRPAKPYSPNVAVAVLGGALALLALLAVTVVIL